MTKGKSGGRLHELRMKSLGVGGWLSVAIRTGDEERELLRCQRTEVGLVQADRLGFKTTLNQCFGCALSERFRIPGLASVVNGNLFSRSDRSIVNVSLRK